MTSHIGHNSEYLQLYTDTDTDTEDIDKMPARCSDNKQQISTAQQLDYIEQPSDQQHRANRAPRRPVRRLSSRTCQHHDSMADDVMISNNNGGGNDGQMVSGNHTSARYTWTPANLTEDQV